MLMLPDDLIAEIVEFYRTRASQKEQRNFSVPYDLDVTHRAVMRHNVWNSISLHRQGRIKSPYYKQPYIIYFNLARTYALTGQIKLAGEIFPKATRS